MKKKEKIREYYESRMGKGLPDYGVLGWESQTAQRLRFDMLIDNVSLEGKSLLDIGCGMGNLLEYINERKINVRYTGVDLLDSMIECAKCKALKGDFRCVDVFKESPFEDCSFDIVYTSGIFNLNLGNNAEFLTGAIEKMLGMAREAVVFNLLHKDSPDREDKYFYYDPEEIKELLKGFKTIERVIIKQNYLKNDFTVICYKRKDQNEHCSN